MRKTSQDGGDTSSITSGIDNEVRKSIAGVVKFKKSSIKRKVQSLSHESDDGVVEPLLQKEKPESLTQSAKYLLSKTKTDIKSVKINDKDKVLSDGKLEKSPPIIVTTSERSLIANGNTNGKNFSSHSGQLEQPTNTVESNMNTNLVYTSNRTKNTETTKSQVLVDIDGSKPSSYNISSLIFTTAKIHSDEKTKHMEPVQVTPVPILSTAEGSIQSNNKITTGKLVLDEIEKKIEKNESKLSSDDCVISDSLKIISHAQGNNVVQPGLTSISFTLPNKTTHSENNTEKVKEISLSKLLHVEPSSSKILDSKINHGNIPTLKMVSIPNQSNVQSNEQKCQYSNVKTINDNCNDLKNPQSFLGELKSQYKSPLNIKETEKMTSNNDISVKTNPGGSKESNAQQNILDYAKNTSKVKATDSQSSTLAQTGNIIPKLVSEKEKQSAHTAEKSESSPVITKKPSLKSSDKPVCKGAGTELPVKIAYPEIGQGPSKSLVITKNNESSNKSQILSTIVTAKATAVPTIGTTAKSISKPKFSDLTAKGNTKSTERMLQNDKDAVVSKHNHKQSVEMIKLPAVSNATTFSKAPITAPNPITSPASENTVNVMSSTIAKPSSSKSISGNISKTTVTVSNMSGQTTNTKTTSAISHPERTVTVIAKEAIATISKSAQNDVIKPGKNTTKYSSSNTKSHPAVTTSSKNITSTKSSSTQATSMSTTDSKSKPARKSSRNSKELKK